MVVITLARKSLLSTVTSNAVKYGTGGINIDACRISSGSDYEDSVSVRYNSSSMAYMGSHQTRPWVQEAINEGRPVKETIPSPYGRWPANLILLHLSGCQCIGNKQVKAVTGGDSSGDNAFGQDSGWNAHNNKATQIKRSNNGDGTETIPAWICQLGCPISELDEQSGDRPGMNGGGAIDSHHTGREVVPSFNRKLVQPEWVRCDTGGASRFFKQIQEVPDK